MDKLLIIANSARMLAQAARNSGFLPFVIDCYGDQDTQNLAEQYHQVKSLSINELKPAVAFFKQQKISRLVYGSGFETHSDSLIFLARHFEVLGNSPKTFIALHNKRDFFQRLQQLNIDYPEVRFTTPNACEGWLIKPEQSQGGLNIQHLARNSPAFLKTAHYYQRYINGKSLSALFLANGKQAQVIGYNQQLVTAFHHQPFVFAAILNQAELSLTQQQTLTGWIKKLSESYGLRGLNSLDFILADDICYVLEINPRPPASMQLYDGDLFTAHSEACQGKFANADFKTACYRLYQIIYAPTRIQIPAQIQWPAGYVDIPQSGVMINQQQPICSIIASGKNLVELTTDLQLKKSFLSTFSI